MKTIRERLSDAQLAVKTAVFTTRLRLQKAMWPPEAYKVFSLDDRGRYGLKGNDFIKLTRPKYFAAEGLHRMSLWVLDRTTNEWEYGGRAWEDRIIYPRYLRILSFLRWPKWATALMLLPLLLVLWSSG